MACLVAAMPAACTDTTDPAAFGAVGTITLTGASTGTYATRPIFVRCLQPNSTYCSVTIGAAPEVPIIAAVVYFPAAPAMRTFASTDVDGYGSAGVSASQTPGTAFWHANASPGSTPVGAFSLTVTEVSAPSQQPSGLEYVLHGTFDATLVATAPATGIVTMHVVF